MGFVKRKCDYCGDEYMADTRNLNRGWGLCCSKSCAANKREKSKQGYDPKRVKRNNIRRATRNLGNPTYSRIRKTAEGYDIIDGTAYDKMGNPVYDVRDNVNLGSEYHFQDSEGMGQF